MIKIILKRFKSSFYACVYSITINNYEIYYNLSNLYTHEVLVLSEITFYDAVNLELILKNFLHQ